jgi:hypothetical protein
MAVKRITPASRCARASVVISLTAEAHMATGTIAIKHNNARFSGVRRYGQPDVLHRTSHTSTNTVNPVDKSAGSRVGKSNKSATPGATKISPSAIHPIDRSNRKKEIGD